MTKSNGQFLNLNRRAATVNVLAAILLILLGIVFQLSELGYGHLRPENFWLFSMIATSLWNLFAIHANAPGAQEVLTLWPVLLIGVGFATLLARTSTCQLRASSATSTGASIEK